MLRPSTMKYTFRDGEFMSGRDKQSVLEAWARFLKGGLRRADFTQRLYEHLSWTAWFHCPLQPGGLLRGVIRTREDTARFLSQFDKRGECRSVEYGGTWWLQGRVRGSQRSHGGGGCRVIRRPGGRICRAAQRSADIAEAQRLLAKHGLQ